MTAPMPRSRPKPKRDLATETGRVLQVYDLLVDELGRRYPPTAVVVGARAPEWLPYTGPNVLLEVADRIAARTEEAG